MYKVLMQSGLALFSPPGAGACDPEILAAMHPLLDKDLQSLAPWRRADPPVAEAAATPAWRSDAEAASNLAAAVLVCGQCASSLDIAWRLATANELAPWDSVLALRQTQGRGQLRRHWDSPAGNVYAALLLPLAMGERGDLAPLLAGCLLARALREQGAMVELKWPNDLLLQGAKVGGVLLEERGGQLMAGVGLNLACAPQAQTLERDPLAPEPGVLGGSESLQGLGPIRLWLELLPAMQRSWAIMEKAETGELVAHVEALLAWKGRQVLLRESSDADNIFDTTGGQVVGIERNGALCLASGGRKTALRSGSVVLAPEQAGCCEQTP